MNPQRGCSHGFFISLLYFNGELLNKAPVTPYRIGETDGNRTVSKVRSWGRNSAASLGGSAASTMTWYPTQSYYPDPASTSPCPVLMIVCIVAVLYHSNIISLISYIMAVVWYMRWVGERPNIHFYRFKGSLTSHICMVWEELDLYDVISYT